jgi:hypothetical protein
MLTGNRWRKSALHCIAFLALLIVAAKTTHAQEDKSKRSSPIESTSCKFSDGKMVTTDYSSPGMKGRKIFGELAPYGKVWRTGANEATTFITDTDVTVGGQDVPAGSYTLFTIPAPDNWTLIISKKTGEPGLPYPEGEDLLRVKMQTAKIPAAVEHFTITYDSKDGSCTLKLSWENTTAWVNVGEKKLCWPTTTPLTYQCPDE